jgi:hypothetical protein
MAVVVVCSLLHSLYHKNTEQNQRVCVGSHGSNLIADPCMLTHLSS